MLLEMMMIREMDIVLIGIVIGLPIEKGDPQVPIEESEEALITEMVLAAVHIGDKELVLIMVAVVVQVLTRERGRGVLLIMVEVVVPIIVLIGGRERDQATMLGLPAIDLPIRGKDQMMTESPTEVLVLMGEGGRRGVLMDVVLATVLVIERGRQTLTMVMIMAMISSRPRYLNLVRAPIMVAPRARSVGDMAGLHIESVLLLLLLVFLTITIYLVCVVWCVAAVHLKQRNDEDLGIEK